MNTQLRKIFTILFPLLYGYTVGFSQESYDATNTPRQYYYNNLEAATAGTPSTFLTACGSTRNSSPATIDIVPASSLNTTQSFSTVGVSSLGYIRWNFFNTGASSTSLSGATWEWEFDYKNTTGASPADPETMAAGTDSWKYWLLANTYNGNNTIGLYVTATGGNLKLRLKYNNTNNAVEYASIALANNKDTYQIRIVKSVIGYYNIYILDRTTGTTTSSLGINVGTNVSGVALNTYNYSYLEAASSATAGRFQWDNFNMYAQRVDYVPLTSVANGITSTIYPGEPDVIPYGINVNVRGDIIFGLITFNSANNGQALFSGGTIYKTFSNYLSPGTAKSMGTYNVNASNTSQIPLPSSEYYYNSGNTNGTTVNVVNYFLDMTASNPFYSSYPSTIAYSVSTAAADDYQSFYTSGYFPLSSASSTGPNVATGNVYDWVGGISVDWGDKNNWSPAAVPGASDQARIGAAHPYTYQPTVSSTGPAMVNVGSIMFGNVVNNPAIPPGVTVSPGYTLNVNGDITKQSDAHSYYNITPGYSTYLAGGGTIKAYNVNIISNTNLPGYSYTENITSSVAQLTLSKNIGLVSTEVVSNTAPYDFNGAFNLTGGTATVTGYLQTTNTSGSKSSLVVNPGSAATLQLNNATALSGLSTLGTNIVDFDHTGATVEYSGTSQTVYTDANITGLTGGVKYYSLKFSNTTGIKTPLTGNLNIDGDFTNALNNTTANYAALSIPTVNFTGTTQALYGGVGTGTTFYNVTFSGNGTKTMANGIFVLNNKGVLTMNGTSTSTVLDGGGLLTLKSDALSSGTIAAFNGPQIIGNVKVERYVTGGSSTYRSYRLFSSPVWQGTAGTSPTTYNVSNLDYIIGSTLVTGASGGGFDKTGNPSIYLFREDQATSYATFTGGNFWGISKLNNSPTYNLNLNSLPATYNMPSGCGAFVFFRGDRTTNLPNKYKPGTSAESVTMTNTGTLNQGKITVRTWYAPTTGNLGFSTTAGNTSVRGFNLVGNPYASSINWDTYNTNTSTPNYGINCVGVGNAVYVLDPVSKNYGTYTSGQGYPGTHGATNIIVSGQGFFVLASSSSATMTFNESAKTNAQATGGYLLLGTPVNVANNQYIRLLLAKDSVNTDDILIRFNSTASTGYVINEDVPYRKGSGAVSLSSISSNNVDLAINNLPLPKTSEVIGLNVNTTADGTYTLSMTQLQGIPQLYEVWLMDAWKKDSLDMRHNPTYSFNVDKKDTTSFGSKRFSLVIRQNPAYAYHLLNFTASKITAVTQVQVVWKTENEGNFTHFTVERSVDGGKTFDVICSQGASDQGTYSLVDQNPVKGQNLYRLKQVDINGAISYSQVIPVMYGDKPALIVNKLSIYPNLASSMINLVIDPDVTVTSYSISITNSTGLIVKQATASQNTWQANLSNLLAGTYIVHVVNNKDKTLVGKTKFVKL